MHRQFLIFLYLIFFIFHAKSQQSNQLGKWTSYLTVKTGVDGAKRKNEIYFATTSGLLHFNIENWWYKIFTKTNGLSDIQTSCIAYDPQTDYFFVGYKSGIIDFFQNPEHKIWSIRDIYLNRNYLSKNIYQMKFKNHFMYICTDFGVVVYDL